MNCREFVDFLSLYLDDDLSLSEKIDFEAHLEECPQCVAYLDNFRKTVALVQSAPADDSLMEHAPEELIQMILSVRKTIS